MLRTSVCGLERVIEEPCGAAPSAAPADSRPAPLHAAQSKRTTPEHSLHGIHMTPRRDRGRRSARRAEQAVARTEPNRDGGRTRVMSRAPATALMPVAHTQCINALLICYFADVFTKTCVSMIPTICTDDLVLVSTKSY